MQPLPQFTGSTQNTHRFSIKLKMCEPHPSLGHDGRIMAADPRSTSEDRQTTHHLSIFVTTLPTYGLQRPTREGNNLCKKQRLTQVLFFLANILRTASSPKKVLLFFLFFPAKERWRKSLRKHLDPTVLPYLLWQILQQTLSTTCNRSAEDCNKIHRLACRSTQYYKVEFLRHIQNFNFQYSKTISLLKTVST